mgnify:CR=1 FL=1
MSGTLPMKELQVVIDEVKARLSDRPKLAKLFENCYPNTLATTTKILEDGSTFVFTGDIPAMWLRDSSAQVRHYIGAAKRFPEVAELIEGLLKKQMFCIQLDPYANAYNGEFKKTAELVMELWTKEQNHPEDSDYYFIRKNCPPTDTLSHEGKGAPVAVTGMTWSGFRPSDDACVYGYLVPSNMFASVVLGYLSEIFREIYHDEAAAAKAEKLQGEIDEGIRKYGIVEHEKFGKIYAYETDGMGHYTLMDDANVPSLLSIPYLGWCKADDEIYQNTRRFVLSSNNPFYYEGKVLKGVGSPHTPPRYVWHIALSMQGLTSSDREEQEELLKLLENSDAGTGYMLSLIHI